MHPIEAHSESIAILMCIDSSLVTTALSTAPCKVPLPDTLCDRQRLACAGVLFAGRADGMLEAWDLLDRSHEPVLVTTASTAAVTSLAFSVPPPAGAKGRSMQQLLAVGALRCLQSTMHQYPDQIWSRWLHPIVMQMTAMQQVGSHLRRGWGGPGPHHGCATQPEAAYVQ